MATFGLKQHQPHPARPSRKLGRTPEVAMHQVTPQLESIASMPSLKVALDVAKREYKVAMSDGGARVREVRVPARSLLELEDAFARGKKQFGLPADAAVICCHEAGRDGFWLDRALKGLGVASVVFDPGSLEANGRQRKAKTDRLDARKLLTALVRWLRGEEGARAVHVPGVEDEDHRRVHRELGRLKGERTAHRSRIRSLLATQGVEVERLDGLAGRLDALQLWDERPVPPSLQAEIRRECERLALVDCQIATIEEERRARVKSAAESDRRLHQVKTLMSVKGIGPNMAWLLVDEMLGWRGFRNRRELAAAAGLAPTPYATGETTRERGISKAGNRRVRTMLIEISWGWLRFQPQSRLTKWFNERFGSGKRSRRKGIVALARRLLIELWAFVDRGVVPAGAAFKAV